MRWKEEKMKGRICQSFKQRIKEEWKNMEEKARVYLTAEVNRKSKIENSIKFLTEIESTINYSDDGNLCLSFKSVETILDTLVIFKQFGCFSGLNINTAKTRIVTINFELSDNEKDKLAENGFCRKMICGGDQSFRFLGFDFTPNDLKVGASARLAQLSSEIKRIAGAFPESTTLKGRKTVCSSLMISKLSAIITTFEFSEKELKGVQKIINNFCHKKKIVAGAMKYLSYSKAGIQIPLYYIRYLVARAAMLKKLHFMLSEHQTLPLWGEVLCQCLKYIGFKSPEMLLRSMGIADLKYTVCKLQEMGFYSLAGLFKSALTLNQIHERRRRFGKKGSSRKRARSDSNSSKDSSQYENTCLHFKKDIDGNITNPLTVGKSDRYGRFQNVPDPPNFRSISVIGNDLDTDLEKRNKKSLSTILNELRDGGGRCPAFEASSRNPDMFIWIINSASSPTCLLDEEDRAVIEGRVKAISRKSTRTGHIFDALTAKAQTLCQLNAENLGPGSPIHVKNPFLSWICARTRKSNSKSLYFQTLSAIHYNVKSSTISKLAKNGIVGKISNERIGKSLQRTTSGFNTFKMEKASIEINLGSMRFSREISRIQDCPPKPCHVCGVYEFIDAKNGQFISRNPYRHLLIECTPSRFLLQYVEVLLHSVTCCKVKISYEMLILNEFPNDIIKRCNKENLKAMYTILNVYRCTLYTMYYRRQINLTGNEMLQIFNKNMNMARIICKERGSCALNNVGVLTPSFHNFISFNRLHKETLWETKSERRYDNEFIRRYNVHVYTRTVTSLTRNNSQRTKKTSSKKPSGQKRQILIFESLKKIPKDRFTKSGQVELTEKK